MHTKQMIYCGSELVMCDMTLLMLSYAYSYETGFKFQDRQPAEAIKTQSALNNGISRLSEINRI